MMKPGPAFVNSSESVTPYANVVNTNANRGKRFNNQRKTFYCTHCNNTAHTIDRCYKRHGYPPNHKFKGKGGNIHSNVNAYSANNQSSAASVSDMNDAGHNVTPQSHSSSVNMTIYGSWWYYRWLDQ